MKKGVIMLRCLIVFISLLLVFPAGILSAATSTAKIKHTQPGKTYIPGFRIHLETQINEPSGVLTTRCYFKTKNDKNFAFVKMTNPGDDNFKAVLPAPFVGSEAVEYLFVSVNKEKKVTRTEIFVLEESETKEGLKWKDINDVKEVRLDRIQDAAEKFAMLYDKSKNAYVKDLPGYQAASKSGILQIGTDIPKNQVPMNGFYDTATIEQVSAMARYGLAAKGLYSAETVSAAGGTGASGATSSGTVTASTSGSNAAVIGGLVLVAGGGAALAAGGGSSSSSGGGGTPPPVTPPVTPPVVGLTTSDLVATWSISGAGTDWHSAGSGPYVLSAGGTWSGMASSPTGPKSVGGTWSFNETSQALTLTESTAGFSATISAGVIAGSASSFTVAGVLPVIPYTNNGGTSFASQAPDTFTFTKM